jgi:hypothetical protein
LIAFSTSRIAPIMKAAPGESLIRARRSFPANASYDDFSNARTPQNRDSYQSVAVGCAQLSFEPGAILLNGFHGNLQLLSNFRGRFAIAK